MYRSKSNAIRHQPTRKAAELLARLLSAAPLHIEIDVQPAGIVSLNIRSREIVPGPSDTLKIVKQLLTALKSTTNPPRNQKMKPKSILQILNAELNTCKANAPREKVMVAGGWFIKETAEQTKKDLKEFKAFVKEKFRQQASDLVVYFGHSRQKAEAAALETARSRIKCWKEAQA